MAVTLKNDNYSVCLHPFNSTDHNDTGHTMRKVEYVATAKTSPEKFHTLKPSTVGVNETIYLDSQDNVWRRVLTALRGGGHLIINAHGATDGLGQISSAYSGGVVHDFSDALDRMDAMRGANHLDCYVWMMVCHASHIRGALKSNGNANWSSLRDMGPYGVYGSDTPVKNVSSPLMPSAELGDVGGTRSKLVKLLDLKLELRVRAARQAWRTQNQTFSKKDYFEAGDASLASCTERLEHHTWKKVHKIFLLYKPRIVEASKYSGKWKPTGKEWAF